MVEIQGQPVLQVSCYAKLAQPMSETIEAHGELTPAVVMPRRSVM